jgi:nucleotide-binding universal stress UspA family protein
MAASSFRSILIATDFSAHAEYAVELGTELASKLGARVHLVHAYDLPIPTLHPYSVTLPDPYIRACRDEAARRLEETLARIRDRGVEAESHLAVVPAAEAIAATAEEAGCDLIVMGTRGHRGLARMLLGSVAERTLRAARCSVLTVSAPNV